MQIETVSQLQELCCTQHKALRTGSKVPSGCAPASSTGPSSQDKRRASPPSTLPSAPGSNAHQSQTLPSDTLRVQGSTARPIPVTAETSQVRWKSLKKKKGGREALTGKNWSDLDLCSLFAPCWNPAGSEDTALVRYLCISTGTLSREELHSK